MNSKDLEALGFEKAADVFVRDQVPDALFTEFGKTVEPGVYCWLQKTEQGEEEVVYVGMFGGSLPKRFREHRRGFQGGSSSGVKKGKFLYESLDAGGTVSIYAKASAAVDVEYTDILGNEVYTAVSVQGMDEIQMIEHVTDIQGKPVLNGTKGG